MTAPPPTLPTTSSSMWTTHPSSTWRRNRWCPSTAAATKACWPTAYPPGLQAAQQWTRRPYKGLSTPPEISPAVPCVPCRTSSVPAASPDLHHRALSLVHQCLHCCPLANILCPSNPVQYRFKNSFHPTAIRTFNTSVHLHTRSLAELRD